MNTLEAGISGAYTEFKLCQEPLGRVEALRSALRQERQARKEAESIYRANIQELGQENECVKASRRLATDYFDRKVKEQCARDSWAAKEEFRKQTQEFKFQLNHNHYIIRNALEQRIAALELRVKKLEQNLETAKKFIAWLTKQYFGDKSEKLEPQTDNGTPATDNVVPIQTKRKRGQQPGSIGHGRSDRSRLDAEEEILEIPNCACEVCGVPYRVIAGSDDSEVVEVDVKAYRRVYRRKKYVSQCQCLGKKIKVAPAAPKLYPKAGIGNSVWAYLIIWKYLRGTPTNRILQDLSLRKLPLSIGTVSGGCRYINELLDALYRSVAARCQSGDLWNSDETTWRVFEEDDGTRCKKKWWFWVFAGVDAIVYRLDKSRSKEVPQDFYRGSSGTIMSDRYSGYKSLPGIKNAWCWVHVKRDFHKIFVGMPPLKDWAQQWLVQIGLVFSLNHKRVELWKAGDDFKLAQHNLEQHMQHLKELFEKQLQEPNLHKQQYKVLNSLKNHWEGLVLFLSDPRIKPDNNRAERLLRSIVINRKNSYGSGSEWSGMFAAKLFTILQTWQINGLNPEALLLDYCNECSKLPKVRGKPPPVPDTNLFLPWTMSDERKQKFFMPNNTKKVA